MRVLFDQLEFRTLLPRLMEAVGEVGAATTAEAETIEADVEVLRDPSAVAARLDEVRAAGARYALEPRWEGVPGHAVRSSASRLADDAGRVTYFDGAALGDPDVAAAARARCSRPAGHRSSRTAPRS